MTSDYFYIDQQASFEAFCQTCSEQNAIAIDTEFIRVSTFFAKPGLIQINNGSSIGLIDPLAITHWESLKALLESKTVCKVMHACDEDIELFYHFLSVKPQAVFDTQFAAGLLGESQAISYQGLVELYLGIAIEKDQRRSDWLKRPLESYQLAYAAADVRYLLTIYQQQKQRLQAQEKLALMDLHYQEVLALFTDDTFGRAVWRINDGWRLNPLQFARLKQLAAWREQMMRKYDKPRKKIAGNQALVTIATQSHWNKFQLFEVEELSESIVRKEADSLLALLEQVNQKDDYSERMYKPIQDKLQRQLKQALNAIAETTQIHPQLLIKKSQVKLLREHLRQGHKTVPEGVSPWRQAYYQQALEQVLMNKGNSE